MRTWIAVAACVVALVGAGCTGVVGDTMGNNQGAGSNNDDDDELPPGQGPPVTIAPTADAMYLEGAFGQAPLRRLTARELATTVANVFKVDPGALTQDLPADLIAERGSPFDNDEILQDISTNYVQSVTAFADTYGDLVAANKAAVNTLAGCTPTKAGDLACFDKLVANAGRLMLRRALTSSEVATFAPLLDFAVEANDFYTAVSGVVHAFVTHPEFIFRFERGEETQVAGQTLFALTDHEIASRLAFMVWGAGPDDALLTAAEHGELHDPANRRAHAERLYDDARARPHWRKFHAQWLGYDGGVPAKASADLALETNTVIDAIAFDDTSLEWLDLFKLDRTFVTPALAKHYGMPAVSKNQWIDYDNKRGGGILAQGMFLQQGAKFGDTSPTLRGYRILKRILCQELGPVPVGVDTDVEPTGASPNACKPDRYTMRTMPVCQNCHVITDGIGFGLENYGPSGEWRDEESVNQQCSISGDGDVLGVPYSGPKELGGIIAATDDAITCSVRQLFRFTTGRTETSDDVPTIAALASQLGDTPSFRDMVMALVSSPAITFRAE